MTEWKHQVNAIVKKVVFEMKGMSCHAWPQEAHQSQSEGREKCSLLYRSQGIFPHPGIRTQVFRIAGKFFTIWATREAWRNRGGEAKRRSQSLLCFLWEKQGRDRQTLGYLSNSSELWGTGLSLLSGIWYWDDLGQGKYWLCMWLLPQGGGWWCRVWIGWFV